MVVMLFVIALLIFALVAANMLKGFLHSRLNRKTVNVFDLKRYMGVWYEIARLENRFEQGMVASKAQYQLLDDGSVEVINSGRCPLTGERKVSVGRARTTSQTGRLKVSFMSLSSADYNVLELGADYDWALVGSHSPAYLWVLSRTPSLPEATFDNLKMKAQERGYDVDQLVVVDQRANFI